MCVMEIAFPNERMGMWGIIKYNNVQKNTTAYGEGSVASR
jgi:hypothetical protein